MTVGQTFFYTHCLFNSLVFLINISSTAIIYLHITCTNNYIPHIFATVLACLCCIDKLCLYCKFTHICIVQWIVKKKKKIQIKNNKKKDLWQAHYAIFSIIFLKEFVKWNLNIDMVIKNVKLNIKIASAFLNTQILNMC